MRQAAVIVLASLLSLTFIGCEREDLHYDNPETWNGDIDEEPFVPEGNDNLHKTADLLAGEWKGTMETDYIDSYSDHPTHKRYDDVTLVFQPFAEKAVNGTGKETICEQGKVVWRMPFKWHVDTLDAIVIKNDENVVMTAKKYELTSDIFNATFISSDLLETAVYSLKRSSEP